MKSAWLGMLVCLSTIVSACGSDDPPLVSGSCGPNGECPANYQCNPVDNRCYFMGRFPDGGVAGADAAGAPDTTITAMPPALGNQAEVTFMFTSDRAAATFECRIAVAEAPFEACTSPHTFSPGDGAHVFEVRAVAGGLTDPTPASHEFTIDTVAPTVTITSGPSGTITVTDATFTFVSSESGSTFSCRLDSPTGASCTSPSAFTGLSVGTHTFVVTATDPAGNTSAPAMRVFTIQALPAIDTTITDGPPATTASTMAMFSFTSNREGATFECSLDDSEFEACVPGVTFADLDAGGHTFEVRARLGDEVDATPASRTWTIDPTGIVAVITGGAEGGVSAASVTFTYMASDPEATFECGLDGAFEPCDAAGTTFSGLEHGSMHTFSVRASKDGVTGEPVSRAFTVDAEPPVVTIASPADGSTVGAMVTLTFTVSEAATVTCTIDGDAVEGCVSGAQVALDAGEHTLVVNAVDAVGNAGSSTSTFDVVVVGPTASISSPGNGEVVGPSGDILFSTGEGTASVVCTMDGEEVSCSTPAFPYLLPGGEHTFTVQAFDEAGNAGEQASVTFIVDDGPPIVESIARVGGGTAADVSLAVELSDLSSVSSVQCRLDGGRFFRCGSSGSVTVTFEDLAPGTHLFEVFGIDVLGNSGLTTRSEDPPAPFARFELSVVVGPGHLVLIGHDFEDRCNVVDKLPGIDINQCGTEQVLVNAAGLSPALEYERGLRVAAFATADTDPDELDNVAAILDEAYFGGAGDLSWLTVFSDAGGLATALGEADVLIVLDQNDAAFGDLGAIAQEWEASLLAYLEAGGIVVVTSGVAPSEDPSTTFALLGSQLLAISAAQHAGDFQQVPCNDADPILAFFEGDGTTNEFFGFAMVGFVTSEPWIAYQAIRADDDSVRNPTVLHKWFGETEAGPIGVFRLTRSTDPKQLPEPVEDYVFQALDGELVAHCGPAGNGTAVHHMFGSGHVSAGFSEGVVGAKPQDLTFRDLMTVMSADPLEHIIMTKPLLNVLVQPPPVQFSVEIDLPVVPEEMGTPDFYRVQSGCDFPVTSESRDLEIGVTCTNQNGTFSLVAEAVQVNQQEESETAIAYIILNGVSETTPQPVQMPAWTATQTYTFDVGTIENIAEVFFWGFLRVGDLFYDVSGPVRDEAAPYEVTSFTAAGQGTPAMTHALHFVGIEFEGEGDGFNAFTIRDMDGTRPSSWSFDLDAALLPRFNHPEGEVEDLDRDALLVTLNIDGADAFDGGSANFEWNSGFNVWTLVFPGSERSFHAPPAPWVSAGEVDSLLLAYWPTLNSQDVTGAGGKIEEASFVADYGDYKRFFYGSAAFPTFLFSMRQSALEPPTIIELPPIDELKLAPSVPRRGLIPPGWPAP